MSELDWVVNMPLSFKGARYRKSLKACMIDFSEPDEEYGMSDVNHDALSIYYACSLVHEATHGKIDRICRRNESEEERFRSEKICRSEEARFLSLAKTAYPEAQIHEIPEVDQDAYRQIYRLSNWDHCRRQFRRLISGRHE